MRIRRLVWYLVFLILASVPFGLPPGAGAATLRADERAPEASSPDGPAALVRQLADPDYARREAAERALRALGAAARPSLRGALTSDDPEVRRRARRILGRLLEGEYERRLQAFIDDKQGAADHDLPGWRRFREMVGDSAGARDLFIRMHKEEAALLSSADAGADPAAEALQWRLQELVTSGRDRGGEEVSLGSLAAVLFVSGDADLQLPAGILDSRELTILGQHQVLNAALLDEKTPAALRKLVGQWLLRPTGTQLLHVKLRLALQHGIEEGFELGVRALGQKELPGNYRFFGIPAIAQLGGVKHAARLTALLDDKTEVTRRPIRRNGKVQLSSIQVRDIALGWLVHLTGQDLAEYHLAHAKSSFAQFEKNNRATPSLTSVYFMKDEERDAALARWNTWAAEHPLPEPPALPASADQPALAPGSLVPGRGIVLEVPGAEPGEEAPALGGITPADRLVSRQLDQARRRMEEGSFGEAAMLLGSVLEDPRDYTYQPERLVALRRGLKSEAERLLADMPVAGRQAYELQFGTEARNLLDDALRTSDAETLAAVGRRYFHTGAGQEATYLLASRYYDRDQPLRAALLLERLRRDGTAAKPLEPALSLKLAACWLLADLPERAERVLRQARSEYGASAVRQGERSLPWFGDRDGPLVWLRRLLDVEEDGPRYLWPLDGGNLARNRASSELQPYLNGPAILPSADHPRLRREVADLFQRALEQYETNMPSCQPLVIGDRVVTRTATDLCALDGTTGALLWKAPLDDALHHLLDHELLDSKSAEEAPDENFLRSGLQRRLWDNPTYGTLSSNGPLVFAVEGLGFGKRGEYQRLIVMPDGRRRLDADGTKSYNRLAAYSVETGKLQWELGGPLLKEAAPLAGTFFLGPPLPVGRRLYVVGKQKQRNHLLELDAQSGAVTWDLVLDDDPQPAIRTSINRVDPDPDQQPSLREGLSPSYDAGILVTPTDEGVYVATELATRTVRWVFEAPRNLLPVSPMGMINPLQRQQQLDELADSRLAWADSRIVLAGDRVLLTPIRADQLFCLDLKSGEVRWSVSRRDGLYLAGVTGEGVVVVAGRANVWGLRLEDGSSAWQTPAIGLPPGALPSGYGYLAERHFHLPLTTGEVAMFDVRDGVLVSRTRASEELVPGNLVPCRDAVLSQNVRGLWKLETLEQRSRELARRLADNPADAQTLALRGELSLNRGRIDAALDDLRESLRLKPRETTRRLLLEAAIEAIRRDFAGSQDLIGEIEPLLRSDEERLQYERLMARALRRAGKFEAAVDHYLRLVKLIEKPSDLEFVAAGHQVRNDRWLRAELDDLLDGALPDQEALLRERVLALRGEVSEEDLLRFFGGLPLSHTLRLALAVRYAAEDRMLEAELLLRQVLSRGDSTSRDEAIGRLAGLLHRADRPREAARFYAMLGSELRDVTVFGETTGGALFDQLAQTDPVRGFLDGESVWPRGEVGVKQETKSSRVQYGFPIRLHGSEPLAPRLHLMLTSGTPELVAENDWATRRVQIKLSTDGQRGIGAVPGLAEGALRGHLFVGWLGDRVVAAELLDGQGKLLWSRSIQKGPQALQRMKMAALRFRAQQLAANVSDSAPHSLAVAADCACFVEQGWLVCVDLVHGKTLWKRDGFLEDCDLLADHRRLIVTPPGQTESRVLRLSDGSDVATCRVPPLETRWLARGDQIITWQVEEERARLRAVNPLSSTTLWQRDFDPKARPAVVGDGQELVVVEPDGKLVLLDATTGAARWEQTHPDLARCADLFVMRSDARYLLFNNATSLDDKGAPNRIARLNAGPGNVAIHGHVVALDSVSGKPLWSQSLDGQSLNLNHPTQVPVLSFFSRIRVTENNRTSYRSESRCYDARSGKLLHEETHKSSNNLFEMDARPRQRELVIRSIQSTLTLKFQSEAASGRAEEKPEKPSG